MKRRIAAAVLACALMTSCAARPTEPVKAPEDLEARPVIAYVPLDDRPDNVERVVYLAESVGYALEMPELDLYRTRLDGQPLNGNGTQCGDPWALYQWVLAQEAAGCDRYILSLDQLHSGGLVASRSASGYECSLPDGGTAQVHSMLDALLTALSADKNNLVWLLDSVMRLAPTVGYEGGTLDEYNQIRAFGALPRRTLEGQALNLESIDEGYWWGPDGEDLRSQAKEAGAYETALQHVRSRERKLTLSYVVQDTLAQPGYENFRLLIGIDDSSLEDCIQKNEIAFLRQGLRVDADLAFKAVARMYLDESGGLMNGTAAVRYFGGTEDQPACDYDFQPLEVIMEEHFRFFGLEAAEPAEAVLQVLVLTQPEDDAQREAYCTQLLQALQECRKDNRPVVLIDAGNGRYGTAFHDRLTKEIELGWLLSYAGFLDMAIVTGTALSHGAARLAVLQRGGGDEAMERAFGKTLVDSVIKDFCYKNVVREDLLAYIRNDLGGDPNNFWVPDISREDLLARLKDGMDEAAEDVIRNFERSNLLVSLAPSYLSSSYAERGWGGVALEDYCFPWDRAFEIGMDIWLGDFMEPHKQILGVYYK